MRCPFCRAENDDGAEVCFKCGRGLFALTQGYIVASRYEILATLGQGGMGTVYKAHDRELDEVVALKVLRGDLTKHPEIAKRFRSEIKLARRIRHRNVCGIHEYGQHGHLRYIAMEFISGVDLRRVLRERGALPHPEAFDVAIQVAEGLQAIHDEGIVHRDLKTPNMMRDARGLVRLMDFGIAKQWESETGTQVTAAGQIVGTPEYMSPEQVRGQKIDSRSDIYALGIVTFELFTGQVPFRGDTPMVTLFQHLQDAPPLEGPSAARIPEAVIPILRKALAKEPVDRYGMAREMAEALREAQRVSLSRTDSAPFPKPLLTATAPETQPEPAEAVTPVPTYAPTEVPTLAPSPARDAPAEAATKGTAKPAEVPIPADATVPVAPATPAPTAVRPPMAPRPGPQTRPQRLRFAAWASPRWLPAAAAVGGLLAIGTVVVLIRERTTPGGMTSTAGPETLTPAGTPPPSAAESVSEPAPTPSRVPEPSPTPPVVRTPEPASPRAMRTDRPTTSATRPTATPSPSGLPAFLLPTPSPPPASAPVEAVPTLPSPSPTAAAPAREAEISQSSPPSTLAAPGTLVLKVKPGAEVTIDGRPIGRTLPPKFSLSPGPHTLILSHPDFEPFKRIVTIRSGETSALTVDLKDEAVRRKH